MTIRWRCARGRAHAVITVHCHHRPARGNNTQLPWKHNLVSFCHSSVYTLTGGSTAETKTVQKQKKAHKMFKRFLVNAVDRTTASRLARENVYISFVCEENTSTLIPVNQLVVPGSNGPSPEQEFMLMCLFCCLPVVEEKQSLESTD